jgi:acetyl esterase
MLHPKVRALLIAQSAAGLPPVETLPVEQARRDMRLGVPALSGPPVQGVRVTDRTFTGPAGAVPVRTYTPEGDAPFAGLVYFHGGGFVIGDLETHDPVCRRLAVACEAVVVAVDYRLAPEHRFPAAAEDAVAATRWVAGAAATLGIDPDRLFTAGDSAGGTLAAVAALAARDAGGPRLAGQVLVYPVTDHHSGGHASYTQYSAGYGLSRDTMVWFWEQYVPGGRSADDARISPLRAGSLADLPPAFVATAEFDVLRDEGLRYVERLVQAGVAVTHRHFDTLHHGFLRMFAILDEAQATVDEIGAWVRRVAPRLPEPAAE